MTAAASVEITNIGIAEEFARTFSTGNVQAIVDALHPEATYWVSGKIEGMSGSYTREQLGQLLSGVTTIYKGGALKITPTAAIAQGDKVAVEAEGYAELNDGRVYNPQYHFLFTIKDGSILEVKEYLDTQHAYETFYAG
jgi:ketosteroid isomerase-like protein